MTTGGNDATRIDKNANAATYHRPPWLTDDSTWGQIVVDLTDHWSDLLRAAAQEIAAKQRKSG